MSYQNSAADQHTELRTINKPPTPQPTPLSPNPKRSFIKRIFTQTGSLSFAKPAQEPTLRLFRALGTGSFTAQNTTRRTTGSDWQGEMAHPSRCAVVPTVPPFNSSAGLSRFQIVFSALQVQSPVNHLATATKKLTGNTRRSGPALIPCPSSVLSPQKSCAS